MHILPIITLIEASFASSLIASLGSSYAFGYGLQTAIGGYLQQRLATSTGEQWQFKNLAVSGSKLKDITASQAPKLKGQSPDIVYVLSGGNDINYVGCLSNPAWTICAHPEAQSSWQADFGAALDAIFTNVANPTSTAVYIVTYPIAIGPLTKCSSTNAQCPIGSSAEVDQINKLYNDQVDWTVTALKSWQSKGSNKKFHTTLIPMRQNSKGHEVGSQSAWVNGANVKNGSWHPNENGASNIADFILKAYGTG